MEQKNRSVVRYTIGYDRLESLDELVLLRSFYADLRLYINFFQPVLKQIGKERVDGKIIRTYEKAKTPYRQVMALKHFPWRSKLA